MLRSVNEKAGLSVGFESLYKSLDEDYEYKYRQYPLEIRLELGRKTDAGALIDLGNILIKPPAPLADAKQQIDKRADRQKQVDTRKSSVSSTSLPPIRCRSLQIL